jgi:hypothetical protein
VVIPVITLWQRMLSVQVESRGTGASRNEALSSGTERAYDDRERNAKVVRQTPVSLQFLLITKLRKTALVGYSIAFGCSPLDC